MLPARFLQPWEVLEMDTQDMGENPPRATDAHCSCWTGPESSHSRTCPLRTKDAESVAKKLLDLLLVSGIPRSIRSDPGTEFTGEVVQHLCRWLKVPIDFWPVDHAWAQEAVERLGGWIHEALTELCKRWPKRLDECVQPALWLQRTTPLPLLPGSPTP